MGKFFKEAGASKVPAMLIGAGVGVGSGVVLADNGKEALIKGTGGAIVGAAVGYGFKHTANKAALITEKANKKLVGVLGNVTKK